MEVRTIAQQLETIEDFGSHHYDALQKMKEQHM